LSSGRNLDELAKERQIRVNSDLPLYQDGNLSVDFREQLLLLDGERLVLRKKEFDLLVVLVRNAGQVVPRQSRQLSDDNLCIIDRIR
jgi:DNA-binding response OmpR family regulator